MWRRRLSHTSSLGSSVLFIMTGFAYIILYAPRFCPRKTIHTIFNKSTKYKRGVDPEKDILPEILYFENVDFFNFGTCWETNKKLKNTTEANKNIKFF